ncbi:SCAN domain-containing protein 3-like [Macrobrachium nipponense]|uniref:SCAN domain-containing protein 3-like n=1 Tax=Macrobrachium nipponense TaxID=159736 RepID=UPI0030C8ACD1
MHQSPHEVTSVISLSNSSVSRRIDEMAADVENQLLVSKLQVNDFSLQLDESTLPDNSALLMAFVRFLDVNDYDSRECFFALKLTTDTKGESCCHDWKAVNLIKKSALRDCLFQQLCEKNNEEFERLLLHTEVRWLSKGNCLHCFVALWDSGISFLSGTKLGQKLVDAKSDIFYLSDIFEKLNALNKELQRNDSNLFSCKEAITACKGKLKLFWLNLGRREFAQFPSLAVISTELLDDDLAVYVDHLKQLHNDMETRFSDLLQMTVPHWFVDPFIADASEVDVTQQESFIELQNNTTAQARFKCGGHQKLWMNQDVFKKYPQLWNDVKLLLLAFPTSYLVETGFSWVMYLLSDTKSP